MPSVAVPPRVKGAVTVLPLAALRVAVMVAVPPETFSATAWLAAVKLTVGVGSLSRMVPVAVAGAVMVAFIGALSVRLKVSSSSSSRSPSTGTLMVLLVLPAEMVTVPLLLV